VKRYKKKRRERYTFDEEKYKAQSWKNEHKGGGFRCSHCKQFVVINDIMGTANRNHCNMCLWSKHVDEHKGDRKASCQGGMEPIGLTFKHEGFGRIGEIMLIHLCSSCQKISINRTARDDMEDKILTVFERSFSLDHNVKDRLSHKDIKLLTKADDEAVKTQLFGK
jgi:hypothetical protein